MQEPEEANDSHVLKEYGVLWHGHEIAKMKDAGDGWTFHYKTGWMVPLSCEQDVHDGTLPHFVWNLMPETGEGPASSPQTIRQILSQTHRFLSNIAITDDPSVAATVKPDVLEGRLSDFTENETFCGTYSKMPRVDSTMLSTMSRLLESEGIPRMSGFQAKLPCNLDESGQLAPAGPGAAFTHILKLPGLNNDPNHRRGAVEWASMTLAKAAGVDTAEFALIELPQDNQGRSVLAYVTERFDLGAKDDPHLFYCEDLSAAIGHVPSAKYSPCLRDVINTTMRVSTSQQEDGLNLFKLIYANQLLENGDFHCKNAAILREVLPTLDGYKSTRLAPAYDIMNTRYFNIHLKPEATESMALAFDDDDRYTLRHYEKMADALKIDRSEVPGIMFGVANGIAQRAIELLKELPEVFDNHPLCQTTTRDLCKRAVLMCLKDHPEIPLDLPKRTTAARP